MRRVCRPTASTVVRVCLCAVALFPGLVCLLRLVYGQLYGGECEMTWMYQHPHYVSIKLDREVEEAFPQYSLHLYRESYFKEDTKLHSSSPVLSGIPVLFIPGNAGSHRQVRSSASIALKMSPAEFPKLKHFDFFTVNLNEELSGLFGGVLNGQTAFVAACISHILSLYSRVKPPPLSVALITHSMGGVVAQALFTLPDFNHSRVHTIIALASPLKRPVLAFDHLLQQFYYDVDRVWLEGGVASHVTVVSIAGGERDVMVPAHLTRTSYSINIATEAVPRNWIPADHQAVVWCRRVQLALGRALFHLQDPAGRELTRDPQRKVGVFSHFLFRGREVPTRASYPAQLTVQRWKEIRDTYYWQEGAETGYSAVTVPTARWTNSSRTLLLASNTGKDTWVYACATVQGKKTANCTDISTSTVLLPPKIGVVKYVTLKPETLPPRATHIVASQPREAQTKPFLLAEQCEKMEYELQLCSWSYPWHMCMWGVGQQLVFPANHCSLMNFTVPQLTKLWRAYTLTVTSCPPLRGGVVTPWYPHTPLHNSTSTHLTLPLSLQVPAPPNAAPHVLIWAPHNCQVQFALAIIITRMQKSSDYLRPGIIHHISIEPDFVGLMEKLLVLYAPLMLPWMAAVFISAPGPRHPAYYLFSAIAIIYPHIYVSSEGWLPTTDWQLLASEGLWCVWVPHLLHSIAVALQQLTQLVTRGLLRGVRRVAGGRLLQTTSCTIFAVSVATLCICSNVSQLLMTVVYALNATGQKSHDVVCVLLWLQLFTLPSLICWVKALHFAPNFFPDPHFWPVTVANVVAIATLLWRPPGRRPSRWLSLLDLSTDMTLSLLLLVYAIVHAYRATHFMAAYVVATAVKQLLFGRETE